MNRNPRRERHRQGYSKRLRLEYQKDCGGGRLRRTLKRRQPMRLSSPEVLRRQLLWCTCFQWSTSLNSLLRKFMNPSKRNQRTTQRNLRALMETLRKTYPDCNMEFRVGNPAEQVTQLARETNGSHYYRQPSSRFPGSFVWVGSSAADLASRRLSGSRLPRGSRVEGCATRTKREKKRASQILPRAETESAELGISNSNIRTIVVAIDLTPRSQKTAAYTAEFAKRVDAALTFVHVFAPEPVTEFTSEQAHEAFAQGRRRTVAKLAKLIEDLRRTGVECHDDFRIGDPAEEVVLAAHAIDADLIIAASHHPCFLDRTLGWDQAPRIFHRARCPVLVYQADAVGNI